MKKRLFSIALVLAMLLTMAVNVLAADTTPEIIAGNATGSIGEGETVTVDVTYDSNTPMSSVRFVVEADFPILTVSTDYFLTPNYNENYFIVYVPTGTIPADEVICSITFDLNVDASTVKKVNDVVLNVRDASDADGETFTVNGVKGTITLENVEDNILMGDVNLDGRISNADIIEMSKCCIDLVTFTDEQFARGDLNGDGRISNKDTILLYGIYLM